MGSSSSSQPLGYNYHKLEIGITDVASFGRWRHVPQPITSRSRGSSTLGSVLRPGAPSFSFGHQDCAPYYRPCIQAHRPHVDSLGGYCPPVSLAAAPQRPAGAGLPSGQRPGCSAPSTSRSGPAGRAGPGGLVAGECGHHERARHARGTTRAQIQSIFAFVLVACAVVCLNRL